MNTEINEQDILAAVNAEVGNMSKEQLAEELLKFRVRAKVQQKKNYGSASQKASQAKQRAKIKALREMAEKLGLTAEIEAKANELADQKLAEDAVDTEEVNA